MKTFQSILFVSIASFTISSCGSSASKRNTFEKQPTASDIKVSHLDLSTNELDLRFEYRSYHEKTLEHIKCDLTFNTDSKLSIEKKPQIKLDPFSTEIIKFKNIQIKNGQQLAQNKSINYILKCDLFMNKGREFVEEYSVLHQVPGTQNKYR